MQRVPKLPISAARSAPNNRTQRFAAAACFLTAALTILLSARCCAAQQAIPSFATAAAARAWAEAEEHAGNLSLASTAYYKEAAMRRSQGDEQAAEVEELRASRVATDIALAVPVQNTDEPLRLAKLEPRQGCLIGVRDEEGTNADSFTQRLGRPISIVYDYLAYGDPFPMNWAQDQARAGRAIQIAWEPADIHAVLDDEYLEGFAQDAARCGTGVFIRFGGEMNGSWTTWGSDPAAYVAAFRTVHDVMARFAPNAAMVWAPNQVPLSNIDRYYPGDRYVDWVGISVYTVRYYDDDLSRPAFYDSPATMIEPFYKKYAARKPICLVECGVSRRSKVENTDADDYAAARICDLMNAVRVRFPRLKMLCFFDRNNLTGAIPGRRLNDYSLADGSLALQALKQAASDPYFLFRYSPGGESLDAYEKIGQSLPVGFSGPILASIITYDLHPALSIKQGDKTQTIYRPYWGRIEAHAGPVTVTVIDSKGRIAGMRALSAP